MLIKKQPKRFALQEIVDNATFLWSGENWVVISFIFLFKNNLISCVLISLVERQK